jgi:hypothetical protein
MALDAAFLVVHPEGPFSVMAVPAELAFVDFAHVHFIRVFCHLEHRVMAGTALEFFHVNMHGMAEENRIGALGGEGQVTAAHGSKRTVRSHQAQNYDKEAYLFHSYESPCP